MLAMARRRTDLRDTDPAVHAMQVEGYRRMDAATKFALIDEMWALGRELAIAGIRGRNPDATPDQIQWELAVLLLGREFATKVYRPRRQS